MSAYLILNYDIDDLDAYKAYQGKAAGALKIPDECAPVVIGGEPELIEGERAGSTAIVLRFESKERAREIYDSADYQAIIGERHAATSNHFATSPTGSTSVTDDITAWMPHASPQQRGPVS